MTPADLTQALEAHRRPLGGSVTLSSLFIVCSHGRRSAHSVHCDSENCLIPQEHGWCPGGRPATLEDLGGLFRNAVLSAVMNHYGHLEDDDYCRMEASELTDEILALVAPPSGVVAQ